MSIVDDFLKNKTFAKTISQNSTNLNNKLTRLKTIMDNINSAWPESMNEKKYIFQALNEAGTGIAQVGTKYYLYADNISAAVDLLKDQLPWKGLVGSTKTVKFKKCTPKKPSSDKIKVNTKELRNCGTQLVALGTEIYNIELASYQRISVVVSNTIINLVSAQLGSLSSLNKKLDSYANRIKKVGTTIISICDKYDLAESNVKKVMEELNKSKGNITYGDGSVKDVDALKEQGWTFKLSVAGTYTMSVIPSSKEYTYKKSSYNIIGNAESYSGGMFNQNNQAYNGNMSQGCGAVAQAIYESIVQNTKVNPTTCCSNYPSYVGATFKGLKTVKASAAECLKNAYNRLKNGKPSIVHLTGNAGHYVTVVGIKEGADASNLSYADFLVIDPYDGKVKALSDVNEIKLYGGRVNQILYS